jgi:phenylpropionate dioxygenase-like ring-hydroxylating dioxygenase large terminal subunit
MNNKKRYPMPIPFGWYVVDYATDLKAGEVKSVRYFGQDQVLFRTTNGEVSMLDAYCPHLGAHLGHGGIVNGECIECPFSCMEMES